MPTTSGTTEPCAPGKPNRAAKTGHSFVFRENAGNVCGVCWAPSVYDQPKMTPVDLARKKKMTLAEVQKLVIQ